MKKILFLIVMFATAVFASDSVETTQTATQEIIFQLLSGIVGIVLTAMGGYATAYFKTKIDTEKYGFENDMVERVIGNAVASAEAAGNVFLKNQSKKMSSSAKLEIARSYINKNIDPKVITKYADNINDMIERKVIQVLTK